MALDIDHELRRRAQRLLKGSVRADDISRLVLGLRSRFPMSGLMREIADFEAHADVREKGIVSQQVKDFFTVDNVALPIIMRSTSFVLDKIGFDLYISSMRRMFGDADISASIKLSEVDFRSVLGRIRRKFVSIRNLTPSFGNHTLNKKEWRVFNFFFTSLPAQPAIRGPDPYPDFKESLLSNDIISSGDVGELDKIENKIILYFASRMHNTMIRDVQFGDTPLFLGAPDGKVEVLAQLPITINGSVLQVIRPFFVTEIPTKSGFQSPLIKKLAAREAVAVELKARGKLGII